MAENGKDWITPLAVIGGLTALAVGAVKTFYKKSKDEEVEEGKFGEEGTILATKTFSVAIISKDGSSGGGETSEPSELTPANVVLGTANFHALVVKASEVFKLETGIAPAFIPAYVLLTPSKSAYNYGETVKVEAKTYLTNEYVFQYWDVDGEWLGTANPMNYLVLNNHILTAHFREKEAY